MPVDPGGIPGLLILAAEFLALWVFGYIFARVALRQTDHRLALAQGLIIGPALWGLIVNFALHVLPGLAGALAAWIFVVALAVTLAWRARSDLRLPPRTLAGFSLAGAVVFWIALASRQLLGIPDHILHTMLPATIRAGGWPPTLGWNPDLQLTYHYGIDLLIGLLTPPLGPDLAFTTELLGALVWTSLILQAGTLLLRHGSWVSTLALTPLLLAAGAWTLVFGEQPTLVQVPIPTGAPSAGLRAALTDVYWPAVELPWPTTQLGAPPNIWKPVFTLSYGLAFVALERIAAGAHRTKPASATLAVLVGFLGLLDETVASIVLGVWIVVAAAEIIRARLQRSQYPIAVLRAVAGPLLTAALLLASGGVFTGLLTGSSGSGELTLGWPLDPRDRGAVGAVTPLAAGLGLLSLGSLAVAGMAVLIDRRNRLTLYLVAATGMFLAAGLVLRYDIAPHDIARFDGHARNFALLALLLVLSARLAALRPALRLVAAGLILAFVTWPTVAAPARKLGLAVAHGVQISNAGPGSREFGEFVLVDGSIRTRTIPFRPDCRLDPSQHRCRSASSFSDALRPDHRHRPAQTPRALPTSCTHAPIRAPDTWTRFVCSNRLHSAGSKSSTFTRLTTGRTTCLTEPSSGLKARHSSNLCSAPLRTRYIGCSRHSSSSMSRRRQSRLKPCVRRYRRNLRSICRRPMAP